ncbi:MAG: ATP-binding protein [Lachnospiraceae bacterium]|nr:ATP-binding protein [Lachnospiraceae bacterium]
MGEESRHTLHILAEVGRLSEVSVFVKNAFLGFGFDDKFCRQIDIVVEEIYVNIASYAYPKGHGCVDVECSADDDTGTLIFRDQGIPYNPLDKEDPETEDPYKMTIGGYGIFMVKEIMDEVIYEYDANSKENVLTLRKKR